MKKECCLCRRSIVLLCKKNADGYICNKCQKYIPSKINLKYADTEYLKSLYEENKKRSKTFSCTASYGSLFIDGKNNMFCISNRQANRLPLCFGDIYYVSELSCVGLYCTNARFVNNRVLCDIKFSFTTENTSSETTIARGQKCSFKIQGDKVAWNEPPVFCVFREMFKQMIDNEYFGLNKKLQSIQKMKYEITHTENNYDWAKGIMFFDTEDEPSSAELKKHRNTLVKAFHPDLNDALHEEENAQITARINKAYEILNDGNK